MTYLIHLDTPIGRMQHYIGYTKENSDAALQRRMKAHRAGRGGRLLKTANRKGITWGPVRSWPKGTLAFEKNLKNFGNSRLLCPICSPTTAFSRMVSFNTTQQNTK